MRDAATSAQWRQFAAYLRPLVKSRMTIREFSDRLDLSYPHCSRIVTGATGVSKPTVTRIACVLGITDPQELYCLYRMAGFPPPACQEHQFDLVLLRQEILSMQTRLEEFRTFIDKLDTYVAVEIKLTKETAKR